MLWYAALCVNINDLACNFSIKIAFLMSVIKVVES